MKRFLYISFISIACAWFAGSCSMVHEFPEEGKEVDPTVIETHVTVRTKVSLMPVIPFTKDGVSLQDTVSNIYDRRFQLAIRDSADKSIVYDTMVVRPMSDTSALVVEPNLHARKYTVAVWMDYVWKNDSADLYYLTDTLSKISILPPSKYLAGAEHDKESQHFTQTFDLTPYADQWFCDIQLNAPMHRKMCKVTFVATDLDKYAQSVGWTGSLSSLADSMHIKFTYTSYIASSMDIWTGRMNDVGLPGTYSFNNRGCYPDSIDGKAYTHVGSDYVFVNGQTSSVTISAYITYGSHGQYVNQVDNLQIPTTMGGETVVYFKFFTKEYVPGVGIDPSFDGEFNVNV